ncbi:MAG: hypothetical protein AB8G99_11185 [Planctomycetaceae bacterium]
MSNLIRFSCLIGLALSPVVAQDCDCNSGVSRPYGMAYGQPISYASAPMISAPMMTAGAAGCVPVAQCVAVPMQCQTVAIQPRYEERTVERTVMVPKLVNETRKVKEVEYKRVQRERDVTVYETVPRVRTVKQQRQVLEPVTRTKTEFYTRMKPVTENVRREVTVSVPERVRRQAFRTEYRPQYRNVVEQYTEMVPVRVKKTGTRSVARTVPVTQMRTVMQDAGYWATQQVAVQQPLTQTVAATTVGAATGIGGACGACVPVSCGCQTQYMTQRVYVPRQVAVQQQCTSVRQEMVQVPYQYEEVSYRPMKRERTVRQERLQQVRVPYDYEEVVYRDRKEYRTEQVQRMVAEKRQRTIRFTEMVPRTEVENVRVTEYESVPVKKKETYTALVPREIEREVTVQVYKDTPRRVTERIRVPVSGGTVIR